MACSGSVESLKVSEWSTIVHRFSTTAQPSAYSFTKTRGNMTRNKRESVCVSGAQLVPYGEHQKYICFDMSGGIIIFFFYRFLCQRYCYFFRDVFFLLFLYIVFCQRLYYKNTDWTHVVIGNYITFHNLASSLVKESMTKDNEKEALRKQNIRLN